MVFDITAAIASTASMSIVSSKPWDIIDNVPHFDPSSGMAHALAFALINDGIEPTLVNKPDDANASFSPEYREAFDSVILNISRYKQWFLVLIACQQVRDLDDKNIESFFQMNNTREQGVAKFLKTLEYCAIDQPIFARNAALRAKFEGNRFFEYHTSATTTPTLVTRAINSCPIPGVFTTVEIAAVRVAKASAHDITLTRAIPENALFKARAVLEGLKIAPPKWYMGHTAWENGNPVVYIALVKLIEKAGALTAGVSINGETTLIECEEMYRNLSL